MISPGPIIVDGVFFQLLKGGIGRVWLSLFREWVRTGFAEQILVLDRAGTLPPVPGIRTRRIPAYSYAAFECDRQMVQGICDEEGATLFASTYYTTPLTTPSFFLAYDMVPEVTGMDLTEQEWINKHRAIGQATAYCSISYSTAQDVVRFFPAIPLARITVAHCGVESLFQPGTEPEISRFQERYGIRRPYFLFVGNRGRYKNGALFFRAFSQLPDKELFDIVCVGGQDELDPSHRALCPGTHVHMLRLDDGELRLAYNGAQALVYPSLYEGFGLPVAEALASGCPVITCRNSSLPEVGGDAVLYVREDSPEELCRAMQLVRRAEIRPRMISAGLKQAAQFSWSSMADKVATTMIEARNSQHPEGLRSRDNELPRITLMTPSLNQGAYIEKTIRSVLEQGYPNLEYFIIDGGSTDETVSIIQRYADRITWWVSEKDKGQADAINKGLARATGVIFNWLNSDDYLEPGALFRVAETYRKDPSAAAWVGGGNRLHDNGFLHYISYPNGLFRDHIINNSNGRCFYQPACFMNTHYLKQLGGLREELHFALDYELYIRLTALAPFVAGEGVWCTALAQPEAKTVKDADALWRDIIGVQREYGLDDAVRNLELRLATGTFNYVMPRGIRERLGSAGQSGQLPQGAPEIPFSWGRRTTVCFWGDFSGRRVQATFAVLNELLSVLFQRFEGIALKIFGADGGNFRDLSKPPYFTYCGTTPDQESLRTAKLCIIAHDGMEGADGVIEGCRQNGIPLVVAREVAEQHQIIEGMQGFSATDPFSFAFRSVLPLLDPGVWGNMSAHMLLSHCGQPVQMTGAGELGHGHPTCAAPQPRIHVFIYTWNKCAELEIALRSLAGTAYGNFKLFVLNNGSSDGTEQLLSGLVPALFREYKIVNLPVNIGAAAARNWLFADPENREADYLAYFDDDIEVAPDWLTRLLETLERHPRAGVVGAKIINATGPKVVQHSGGVLTQAEEWINNVVLFSNVPDQGQFDNISERDYVMGCANLYRRSAMDEVGMFDIQFSPTQFDDVDHHLRLRLKGWQVLFNGHVEVRHHRNSGGPANANHLANRFKLEKKYSADDAAKIIAAGSSLDFVAKHPWILQKNG